MTDIVLVLKAHARILHRQIENGEIAAINRACRYKDFRGLERTEIVKSIRRRHCFSIIAKELGFNGWPHLLNVMKQDEPEDFGTFFYPERCRVHWNIWVASYEEAARIREDHGGFLIGYKNQFIVVDDDYIRSFGLNPNDPDFEEVGRDWVRIKNPAHRNKLYGRLVEIILD